MTTDMKSPTDEQVEEIWKTLKFDQCQIFRNPDEAAKHLRGELVRAALASRPDAQADEALKLAVGYLELHGHCDEARKVVDEWRARRAAFQQSAQADERGAFE